MVKYKKIYLKYFNYIESDFIPCEVCGSKAVDIHHIKYKSRGGKDEISNLIALCRYCHNKAHNEQLKEQELTEIHSEWLKK
jgi:5-methylcytosine-specific restriction endonuclease McrA